MEKYLPRIFNQLPFLIATLFLCLWEVPQVHAKEQESWMKQFEATFSASCTVNGISFMYPKQFELSETTMGVFLETKELSGLISEGAVSFRDKKGVIELLVIKQGGKDIRETTINGHTVFTSTSIQGELTCRTYIVVPKDRDQKPLYIQFRWRSGNPIDYAVMLDRMVATIK